MLLPIIAKWPGSSFHQEDWGFSANVHEFTWTKFTQIHQCLELAWYKLGIKETKGSQPCRNHKNSHKKTQDRKRGPSTAEIWYRQLCCFKCKESGNGEGSVTPAMHQAPAAGLEEKVEPPTTTFVVSTHTMVSTLISNIASLAQPPRSLSTANLEQASSHIFLSYNYMAKHHHLMSICLSCSTPRLNTQEDSDTEGFVPYPMLCT